MTLFGYDYIVYKSPSGIILSYWVEDDCLYHLAQEHLINLVQRLGLNIDPQQSRQLPIRG